MAAELDFSGKTALVTGAASGIGAACARWLDAHGVAKLVLIDIDRGALDRLDLSCEVQPIGGDVSESALWALHLREAGRIDCAVLNAGIIDEFEIADGDLPRWRKVMSVNLDGAYLGLRAMMKRMRAQDGGGSIVLTASATALRSSRGTAAYSVSKAGVIQLAKVAAKEGARDNVRVNAIAPGGVDTKIWDTTSVFEKLTAEGGSREEAIDAMARMATPSGRWARPEEIAGQIGFLLSDMAATMTGAVLVSDGGYTV